MMKYSAIHGYHSAILSDWSLARIYSLTGQCIAFLYLIIGFPQVYAWEMVDTSISPNQSQKFDSLESARESCEVQLMLRGYKILSAKERNLL